MKGKITKKITTKYLRENMKEIIDHVAEGKVEYAVTYRSKLVFNVGFDDLSKRKRISQEETLNIINRLKSKAKPMKGYPTDPKSDKEEFRKHIIEKYESIS